MYPKISVVIPTYNRASLLKCAIESVVSQTYTNWELIIVDDGSTDDTEIIVDECKKAIDNNVKYIKLNDNKGVGNARNIGIANSNGIYVALLDSDDIFLPNKLEDLVLALKLNPDAVFVYGGWEWCNFLTNQVRISRLPDSEGLINNKPRWTYNIVPDLVKTSFYEDIKFNESLKNYEIYDLLFKLEMLNNSAFTQKIVSKFRDHKGPRSSDSLLSRIQAINYLTTNYKEFLLVKSKEFYYQLLRVKLYDSLDCKQPFNIKDLITIARGNPLDIKFYASVLKRIISNGFKSR